MESLPDLSTLSDDELAGLLRRIENEEDAISQRRRRLHGRIDVLRAERIQRLREQVASGEIEFPLPESLERPLYAGSGDLADGEDSEGLEALPQLSSLTDDELRQMIRGLEQEEDDISLRRRFLHGQIDILRAERYKRARGGGLHVQADDLGSILGGGRSPGGE